MQPGQVGFHDGIREADQQRAAHEIPRQQHSRGLAVEFLLLQKARLDVGVFRADVGLNLLTHVTGDENEFLDLHIAEHPQHMAEHRGAGHVHQWLRFAERVRSQTRSESGQRYDHFHLNSPMRGRAAASQWLAGKHAPRLAGAALQMPGQATASRWAAR